MKKILFYAMKEEKMCFAHVLLNALELYEAGNDVKIIFEGMSVKLPSALTKEANPLYQKALDSNIIVGVCRVCSKMMGVLEENEKLGLPLLDDMKGHAGIKSYLENGYNVIMS
ncbi:MAG: hypothetical protein GX337_07155 [Christensenellaceae bacterium]|nr:hypothetical protein [Christensenellaceae bacterium]